MIPHAEELLDTSLGRAALPRRAWLRGAGGKGPAWSREGAHRRMVVTLEGLLAVTSDGPVGLHWEECPEGLPADRSDLPAGVIELFLGEEEQPLVALVVPDEGAWELPEGVVWEDLREIGPELGDTDVAAAVTASGMAHWHRRHGFSPETGEPTEVTASGWVRRAPDGRHHFPRTDTAVIMAVVDSRDRLLLARGPSWPEGRLSVLAGFVEPGESLEAAVAREVQEEVSVGVESVRYVGSQPWPFPGSLMVAFMARTGDQPDAPAVEDLEHDEIAEAHWFSREELTAALEAREIGLPGRISIARQLIERWYGGPLPVAEEIRGSVRG